MFKITKTYYNKNKIAWAWRNKQNKRGWHKEKKRSSEIIFYYLFDFYMSLPLRDLFRNNPVKTVQYRVTQQWEPKIKMILIEIVQTKLIYKKNVR